MFQNHRQGVREDFYKSHLLHSCIALLKEAAGPSGRTAGAIVELTGAAGAHRS